MKLKRGVWIAACVIGVIVFGGLAVLTGYILFFRPGSVANNPGVLVRPIVLILVAGACAAGLFMTPREVEEITKPDIDEEPAEWIRQMRQQNDTDKQR